VHFSVPDPVPEAFLGIGHFPPHLFSQLKLFVLYPPSGANPNIFYAYHNIQLLPFPSPNALGEGLGEVTSSGS
jgi:hypothetical protein